MRLEISIDYDDGDVEEYGTYDCESSEERTEILLTATEDIVRRYTGLAPISIRIECKEEEQ